MRPQSVVRNRAPQVARWWATLAVVSAGLLPGRGSAQEPPRLASPCRSAPAPGSGAVTGWAQDAATGVRMGFATVRLLNVLSGDTLRTRADPSGVFAFCSVPAGAWRADAALENWRGAASAEVAAGETTAVVVDLAIPSSAGRSGRLEGRVLDATSRAPVAHAMVEVAGGRRRTFTASDGMFSFPFLEPGDVRFRVTMLGYADAEDEVPVAGGQVVEVEVTLEVQAIALEPITVTAVRQALPPLPGMAELEERIMSGWGQFILEDQIRLRSPTRVTDLLYETGVQVGSNGRSIIMRRSGCAPSVYIDDVKVTRCPRGGHVFYGGTCNPAGEAAEAVNMLDPILIHAIEVYRGPGETPGQYLDSDARCGVILIWTRRGPR